MTIPNTQPALGNGTSDLFEQIDNARKKIATHLGAKADHVRKRQQALVDAHQELDTACHLARTTGGFTIKDIATAINEHPNEAGKRARRGNPNPAPRKKAKPEGKK